MEEEQVEVEVEVARLDPQPLVKGFGAVKNFRTLPTYALLDTTISGGGITSPASATAIYITLAHRGRRLLWIPLPGGVSDSLMPTKEEDRTTMEPCPPEGKGVP